MDRDPLDMFNLIVWGILFFIFMKALISSIKMVPQRYVYIVERLGKYHSTLQAGFHTLIPFFDKVTYILDLKEQTIDVPPQECFTYDEIRVTVDGVLYVSVVDPVKAAYGITNFAYGAMMLAQTTTRAVIGKLELDRTFEEREQISARVVHVLDETSREWGIKVHRYEIKNIMPPKSVHESMEKQVTAEREKQATLAKASGDKQSRINRSEGIKTKMINNSEGQKQRRINEAEGLASQIKSIAEATAQSIEKVAEAISSQNGQESLRLQLVERFLGQFGHLADENKDVLLPVDISNLNGMLAKLDLEQKK